MSISPVEVRHVRLGRGLFGYRRGAVNDVLGQIADSYEEVWRQRADLADRVEELESLVTRNTELETLLRSTLVSAERTAQDLKEHARREAELIVSEAHAEAREVNRRSIAERERLRAETSRARALLAAALETLDQAAASELSIPPAAEPGGPDENTAEERARLLERGGFFNQA